MKDEVLAQHGNLHARPFHGRGHAEEKGKRTVKVFLLGEYGNRASPGLRILQSHVFRLKRFAYHAARGRSALVLRHHGKWPLADGFQSPPEGRPTPRPRMQSFRTQMLQGRNLFLLGLHETFQSGHASTLMPAPAATPFLAMATHSSSVLPSSSM